MFYQLTLGTSNQGDTKKDDAVVSSLEEQVVKFTKPVPSEG